MLRAVSVVHVVVHDRDSADAERASMRCGHGDVVVAAKTHRATALVMMAELAHESECPGVAPAYDTLDGIDRRPCCKQGDLVRVRRRVRIRVQRDRLASCL